MTGREGDKALSTSSRKKREGFRADGKGKKILQKKKRKTENPREFPKSGSRGGRCGSQQKKAKGHFRRDHGPLERDRSGKWRGKEKTRAKRRIL